LLEQEEAAREMNASQPTFHSLVQPARKIADTIVNGKSLKIDGGDYKICKRLFQ